MKILVIIAILVGLAILTSPEFVAGLLFFPFMLGGLVVLLFFFSKNPW